MRHSEKNKEKPKIIYYSILAILFLVVVVLVLTMNYKECGREIPTIREIMAMAELSVNDYLKVDVDASVDSGFGTVVLTGGCYQLEANIEAVQAESIINGIKEKSGPRPNTHDLMRDTFNNLGVDVLMVKITELRNTTFIGKLILKQESKILSLDSRPSDGIALAVRFNAPIYIKEDLIKSEGKYIC